MTSARRGPPSRPDSPRPLGTAKWPPNSTARPGALYRLRKQTVEPVFGIVKAVLGFARFSLRGLDKVDGEWRMAAS